MIVSMLNLNVTSQKVVRWDIDDFFVMLSLMQIYTTPHNRSQILTSIVDTRAARDKPRVLSLIENVVDDDLEDNLLFCVCFPVLCWIIRNMYLPKCYHPKMLKCVELMSKLVNFT